MKDEAERLKIRVNKAWNERQKCLNAIMRSTGKKNSDLRKKFQLLDNKYWLLRERLDYYIGIPVIEDDSIAIKRFGEGLENRYSIFLKQERIRIGGIDYQGYHKSHIAGDIGYYIYDKYRGSNYAYKALCLLSSYLYDNGIPDFNISAFHDNDASLKIIKRYGGKLIYQDNLVAMFQCKTRKIMKEEKPHSL